MCSPDRKAELETRNGVDQLDDVTELVESGARELRESQVLGRDEYLRALQAVDESQRTADTRSTSEFAVPPDFTVMVDFLRRLLMKQFGIGDRPPRFPGDSR